VKYHYYDLVEPNDSQQGRDDAAGTLILKP